MAEIPALTAIAASSSAVSGASSVTPVPAVVASLPDIIQNLSRHIEVTGTIAQMPDTTALVLNTALGNLTLMLPKLVEAKQDQMLQQLITIFQDHKPLTIAIQPGTPPNNAVIFLPSIPQQSPQTVQAGILHPAPTLSPTNIQTNTPPIPGTVLSAIILPTNQNWPSAAETNLGKGLASLTAKDSVLSLLPNSTQDLNMPSVASSQVSVTPLGLSYKDILSRLGPNFLSSPFASDEAPSVVPASQTATATASLAGQVQPNAAQTASLPVLTPGSEMIVRIISAAPTNLTSTTPLPPNAMLATVSSVGATNQPILQTAASISSSKLPYPQAHHGL